MSRDRPPSSGDEAQKNRALEHAQTLLDLGAFRRAGRPAEARQILTNA